MLVTSRLVKLLVLFNLKPENNSEEDDEEKNND